MSKHIKQPQNSVFIFKVKPQNSVFYYVFAIFMVLVARLCSMARLLLELPYAVQKILADQLGAFQRYTSCLHLFACTHVHVRIEVSYFGCLDPHSYLVSETPS